LRLVCGVAPFRMDEKGTIMDRRCALWAVAVCVLAGVIFSGCQSNNRPAFSSPPKEAAEGSLLLPAVEVDRPGKGPVLTDESGLSDYLACAALNNPSLEAAFNGWKAALERVPQVRSLPDPRFTYRYFIEEVETRVGAQRQSFELAQTFPWFGKLELHEDAAAQAANAAKMRYEARKLALFYQVKDAYYEYYYLGRAIQIVKENRDLLTHFESVVRTRYKVAEGSHPDVIRAQVEAGKLEDRLRSLEAMREPVVARLNSALNRPPTAPLPQPTKVQQDEREFTDEQLVAWLAEFNPELKAMDAEIAGSSYRIDLARKDYFPDMTVGVNYIDTNASTGGRHPSDDGKDAVVGMVSVNVPIWQDKLAAGVREARYSHWQTVYAKNDRLNALNTALQLALFHFHDAERKMDLYRDTLLPKAEESIKATEAAFRTGRGSFLDLIDAQRILLEFDLAYERALTSRLQRLAELEMLVGRDIPQASDRQTHQGANN